MRTKKLTHFACDNCKKIKRLRERKIVKVAYTVFDNDSKDEFGCNYHHIQLCKKCYEV